MKLTININPKGRTPKGPIISQIARTLGVTSDWLLGME